LALLDYRQGSMRRFGVRALSGSAPDVALAALLTALNVLSSGGHAAAVGVAIVETAPVALRRRTPLAALAATAIAALGGVVLGLRPSAPGFVAILVLLATVASTHRTRISIPAGIIVGAGAIVVLREQDVVAVGFELALVVAAWILGFNARTRRALTAALADLAASRTCAPGGGEPRGLRGASTARPGGARHRGAQSQRDRGPGRRRPHGGRRGAR
jgi:hypothetical protein